MNPNFLLKYRGSRGQGLLIAVATAALLAGCSTYDSVTRDIAQRITPYRITIVQGNFVSSEAAAKMRVGMSRDQVRQTLGTPLLADMFHADRWDYLFYFKRGSTAVVQQRDFIVHFEGDHVVSWSGGEDLPSELELLADIDGDKSGKKRKAAVQVAASAPAAASASAAAAAPVSASGAVAVNPNEEAAQAANRAVNQVQLAPTNTSSALVKPPTAGGEQPGTMPPPGQPQLQFHRAPSSAPPDQSNPVGPTPQDTGGSDSSALKNQPLTSTQSTNGSGT
jgi:outer membrane protein assembly factor BamE